MCLCTRARQRRKSSDWLNLSVKFPICYDIYIWKCFLRLLEVSHSVFCFLGAISRKQVYIIEHHVGWEHLPQVKPLLDFPYISTIIQTHLICSPSLPVSEFSLFPHWHMLCFLQLPNLFLAIFTIYPSASFHFSTVAQTLDLVTHRQ